MGEGKGGGEGRLRKEDYFCKVPCVHVAQGGDEMCQFWN